ncbi:hypothetical protein [Bythopirellula goksoeyrii]|uniref:PAS fold protein n=1 Tax=Bythopirellula goksoeyrii TaxID=1400387 RepID=A0A5B9QAN9_9BACT|nr:hypothetical protein [Bythopirellula goksoeyrii]QEG34809.1 hypothetical protein Pr1d_20940 [Bythopirellula goksoeyrii]
MAAEIPRYRYRVDRDDLLIWVDSHWLGFAKENGATELTQEYVIGRSLWNFVGGESVCALYQQVHSRVRSNNKPVVLPFRCDTPTLIRHMRMIIHPEEGGQILYESLLTKTESQPYLGILDMSRPRSNRILTLCSCCKRALLEPVGWLAAEDVSARLKLFDAERFPIMRETICPKCAESMANGLDNGNAA